MNNPDTTSTNQWRKVTYSNGQGACIEVGHATGHIAIRDTMQSAMGNSRIILVTTPNSWRGFTKRLRLAAR